MGADDRPDGGFDDAVTSPNQPPEPSGRGGSSFSAPPFAARSATAQPGPAPAPQPGADAPPASVPDFDLLRRIGAGASGEVWIARNRHSGQFRVVKFVVRAGATELEGVRRFLQCVGQHPNLVPIEHVGQADSCLYEVMPLADSATSAGPLMDASQYEPLTLQAHFRRKAPLPVAELAAVATELAAAIDHLHRQGVVHCDIKPANVVRLDGHWRLADHGLVSSTDRQVTTGYTPGYALQDEMGSRAGDIYALGVVLLQACSPARPADVPAFLEGRISVTSSGTARQRRVVTHALQRILDPASGARTMTAAHLVEPLIRAGGASGAAGSFVQRNWRTLLRAGLVVFVVTAVVVSRLAFRDKPLAPDPAPAGTTEPRDAGDHAAQGAPAAPAPPLPPGPDGRPRPPRRVIDGASPEGMVPTFGPAKVELLRVVEAPPATPDASAIVPTAPRNPGDQVTLKLRLNERAHAYVIAVDPHGDLSLLWPPDPDQAPPAVRMVPPGEDVRTVILDRGVGAWAFFAVVSSRPLPAWKDFGAAKPSAWPRALDAVAERGRLSLASFETDGATAEMVPGSARGPRAAAAQAPSAFQEFAAYLKARPGVDAVKGLLVPCVPALPGRPRDGG